MQENAKKKVIIIDDDENLRFVLSDKLKMSGFEVIEAKDGEEGLEQCLKHHPDIVLLDIMMPIMNGIDMLKRLRQDSWGKTAEVIMLTVLENAEPIADAMEGGSFTYMIKTKVNADEIAGKVKEILGE
ncbi:MAG TPA: response regulator [Candidatus Paceibacterota bacterium]